VARTRYDWARLLERRGDPASLTKARALLRDAAAEAIDLGMLELVDKCRTLGKRISDEADAASSAEHGVMLVRQGEVWTLRHDGKDTPIRHSKGVAYIAELLRHPDRDILAIHLLTGLAEVPGSASSAVAREDLGVSSRKPGHFVDEVFDAKARQAYAARVDDLQCELSRAEADGDPERVLELRDELARLERELARGIGLGGRRRQVSDVERARISVTRAIRLALGRIAEAAPGAARVLGRRIRTGTYCCYAPNERRWPRRDRGDHGP
jgi:non-specific serine/threonine protein kinase